MEGFNSNKTAIKDHLLLIAVAIITYWPASLMIFGLKNDAIHYFLAMRFNISDAIQHGHFPYWTPYINLGYPLHGDMQSGVWNPLVQLLSAIRTYDIYWLHVETILVICIAGTTMYHLLKHLAFHRKTVLAVSIAWMLSGFITDAGQFLNWLYAAAYLPLVFLFMLKCFSTFRIKHAFLFACSYSLMFLSAYPADFILISYLIFFYTLFSFFRKKNESGLKNTLISYGKQITITGICFVIICLPAILSYSQFIQVIDRGAGVTLERALSNSLAPANLISFLTPWATLKGDMFLPTDPLTRDCYMGLVVFVFLIALLFNREKKSFLQRFLIITFFVSILFSLGQIGGLRVLAYYTLPLMNAFRHPSNVKLFFIFAGLLLAAHEISRLHSGDETRKPLLKKILKGILVVTLLAIIVSLFNSNIPAIASSIGNGGGIKDKVYDLLAQLSFWDMLLFNGVFVLLITGVFYLLLKKNRLSKYLTLLLLVDMFIIAQGMMPLTYVSRKKPAEIQAILDQQPKGYPLPNAATSLDEYSIDGEKYFDLTGCLNPYNKKPGRSNYPISPANLISQDLFWDYEPLRKKVMSYPLAYFADTVFSIKDTQAFVRSSFNGIGVIAEINRPIQKNTTGERSVQITKFLPTRFELQTNCTSEEVLVFQQNNYPNWKMKVNGKPVEIFIANTTFMGAIIPPGNNTIEITYDARYLGWLAILSLVFVTSCFILLLIKMKKSFVE